MQGSAARRPYKKGLLIPCSWKSRETVATMSVTSLILAWESTYFAKPNRDSSRPNNDSRDPPGHGLAMLPWNCRLWLESECSFSSLYLYQFGNSDLLTVGWIAINDQTTWFFSHSWLALADFGPRCRKPEILLPYLRTRLLRAHWKTIHYPETACIEFLHQTSSLEGCLRISSNRHVFRAGKNRHNQWFRAFRWSLPYWWVWQFDYCSDMLK